MPSAAVRCWTGLGGWFGGLHCCRRHYRPQKSNCAGGWVVDSRVWAAGFAAQHVAGHAPARRKWMALHGTLPSTAAATHERACFVGNAAAGYSQHFAPHTVACGRQPAHRAGSRSTTWSQSDHRRRGQEPRAGSRCGAHTRARQNVSPWAKKKPVTYIVLWLVCRN